MAEQDRHFGGKWEARLRAPSDSYPAVVFMNIGSLTPRDRLEMARRELVEASKALHPDVDIWTVRDEDFTGDLPGFSLIYGQRKAALA
jgi:hypothetical protein